MESIGTNRDHSSKSSEGPCDGHLLPATDPESDSKTSLSVSSDSCKVNANLEDKQDLTRSQMDILKAVTAAFEEILELHGDENDSDDTKLWKACTILEYYYINELFATKQSPGAKKNLEDDAVGPLKEGKFAF